MVTRPDDVASLLALSDERDLWERRLDHAERAGYRRGRADGRAEGWAASERDLAASWRALTEPIAHPERGIGRRIQAAISGERRDQAEHERAFVTRAYATHADQRTDQQAAAVLSYAPPTRKDCAA